MRSTYILLVVMTVILLANAQNSSNSSGVQYRPRPPVQETLLFTIGNSPADGRLIASTYGLQFMQLTHIPVNATLNVTNFDMIVFNRTVNGYQSRYNFTYPGTWTHIESSPLTLSCSIVFDESVQFVGLVLWNKTDSSFRMVTAIPVGLVSGGNNVTAAEVRLLMHVGENCELMSYTLGPLYYVFTAINNYTQQVLVNLPSSGGVNYTIQAYSADLIYSIWNNNLYRYDRANITYIPIFNLGVFDKFSIKSRGNRILVTGANTMNISGGNVLANYTVFILEDLNGNTTLVDNFTILGVVELANGTGFFTFVSPRLTKLGIVYVNTLFNITVLAKHINYRRQNVTNLHFQNLNLVRDTVAIIDYVKQFSMSDQFMVFKNISLYNNSSNISSPFPQFQYAFQMVGNQIVFLGGRNLNNNSMERINFRYVFIDNSVTYNCYVINIYSVNGSYQVVQFNYGNIASNYRVIQPARPPLIVFMRPAGMEYSYENNFQYLYCNNMNTTTQVTAIWPDQLAGGRNPNSSWGPNSTRGNFSSAGNYGMANISINGSWQVKDYSRDCFAVQTGTSELRVYRINRTALGPGMGIELVQPLTSFGGATLSNSTKVSVSGNCWMLRVDSSIFRNQNGSFVQVTTTGLSWTAIDNSLTLLILANNSIARYDPTANSFSTLMNYPANLTASTTIRSFWPNASKIILMDISNSSLWMDLLAWQNGQYVKVFSYSRSGFVGAPTVEVSRRNQTKVLIVGELAGANTSLIQAFSINYTSMSYQNISFPRAPPINITNYYYMSESFSFFRINAYALNSTAHESVFFLSGGLYPRSIYNSDSSLGGGVEWVKAIIVQNNRSRASLLSQTRLNINGTVMVMIDGMELWANEANYDHGDENYVVEVENGSLLICPPGCMNCQCTRCFPGFFRSAGSSVCQACAPGCLTCNQADVTVCGSCQVGSFLNSTYNCQPCQSPCIQCSGSASSCTKCPPGQFPSNSTCASCAANCFNCSSATVCISCQIGFVVHANGTCIGCSLFCSKCNASNITQCTRCGLAMQMVAGQCEQCPLNCLECSGSRCDICSAGYMPNSNGTCVMKCRIPCINCVENSPTMCTGCQRGAYLTNNTCHIDLSCNANNNCTFCAVGFNYILVVNGSLGSNCQPCPSIANCIQCSRVDSYRCSLCQRGYFSNAPGQCQPCQSSCITCRNGAACTQCKSGFTLVSGFSQSACLACVSPCATCIGSPINCMSCIANFTKKGWSCRNNTGFSFSFVINDVLANVMANIASIQRGCLQALGSSNARNLVFERIYTGSTIIAGSAQVSSGSVTQAAQTFSQTISSGIPGTNYTVSSVNIGQNGGSNEQSSESSTGLIIGIICGVILVVVIMIVVCVASRRKYMDKHTARGPQNEVVIEQTPSAGGSSKDVAPFSKEKIPISADSLKSDNLYPDLNDEKYDKNAYYGKDM